MKILITEVKGCVWCPHHSKYSGDQPREGRCNKVFVRKGNAKLIRPEELRVMENGLLMSMEKFPEWCPLDDKA